MLKLKLVENFYIIDYKNEDSMKRKFFFVLSVLTFFMLCACSDDSNSNNATTDKCTEDPNLPECVTPDNDTPEVE